MATKRTKTSDRNSQQRNEKVGTEEMSAVDLLEEDHREVEDLFDEYEKIEDVSEKEQLALKICMALQVHTRIEEEIFYPAAREAIEKPELIDEAVVDHASAKRSSARSRIWRRGRNCTMPR